MAVVESTRKTEASDDIRSADEGPRRASYEAYQALHFAYMILPLVAGLDKFLRLLVHWDVYLSPSLWNHLPITVPHFMLLVGVIEIGLGLLAAARPRLGAYLLMAWLWAIIVNLLTIRGFFDIAV